MTRFRETLSQGTRGLATSIARLPTSGRAKALVAGAAAWIWTWRTRGLGLLAAAGAVSYFGPNLVLGPVLPAESPVRKDFVQTVVASGYVAAPFRVNIGSQITGTVVDVPVKEGQTVRSGEKLIQLDDLEAKGSVVLAQAVVAQAEARMRQMKELTLPSALASLSQAQATLEAAQVAYDRAAKLASDGYGTRATLDDTKRALAVARAQVRSAEYQVFTDTPGGSDYVMAQTQLEQARGSLTTAQSQLRHTKITAPRDGVLIARNVEQGNIVQPSNILMVLSPSGDAQLVVQIDEKNLGLLKVGQPALASADAYATQTIAAKVAFINPGVDLQRASVQVKLDVADPPGYLRQDMTVSVDVEVARHAGALIIALTCVRGAARGKPWVMTITSGRATRQPVKLGLVSGGQAEVIEGLHLKDLMLPANADVKVGARVRARLPTSPAS